MDKLYFSPSLLMKNPSERSLQKSGLAALNGSDRSRRGVSILAAVERLGARFARRKTLVVALAAATIVILRLSLLWLVPVPIPMAHDEFSYLLAADTFCHGRLTNPAHPMWAFFETIHVNQQPTYMSKYPPAQGAVLALGERLGHPWIGVLLSMSAMCAAVTWMLQAWFPPSWALLGGMLVMLRLGAFNYWVDSYWGGAAAAIGGALVMGALPRVLHSQRPVHAAVLGTGLAILVNSRPLEGVVFCLPVAVVLCVWLVRGKVWWQVKVWNVLVPLTAVLVTVGVFSGYYNWRGTGNPFVLPYTLNLRTQFSTAFLLLENQPPPRYFSNPQVADFNKEQREEFSNHKAHFVLSTLTRTREMIAFFGGLLLVAPVVTLPWLIRDRRMWLLLTQLLLSFSCLTIVTFFNVHYAAPLTSMIFAIAVQGLRHLRCFQFRSRPVGVVLTRTIVLVCIALLPAHVVKTWLDSSRGITWTDNKMMARARIDRELEAAAGQHLVLVHYSPVHNVHDEWVYNSADIDHAKVVWAREIPGVDLRPLLQYFHDRKVWEIEPDVNSPTLRAYPVPATP